MKILAERIRQLRKSMNLSQAKIAKMVGTQQTSINRYENDQYDPPLNILIWYADYFDVSLDYLCGRTDKPQGKLYEYEPEALKIRGESKESVEQFVEMCFDPNSPASAKMREAMMKLLTDKEQEKKMNSIRFRLKYVSSVQRIAIGEYTFENETINVDALLKYVFSIIENCNRLDRVSFINPTVYIEKDNCKKQISQADIEEAISSNKMLHLVFSNVVAPFGAAEIARIDGVVLFFNSNENNHSPHIHAQCAEEEISININPPYKIIGKMKKQKVKIVIEYISTHHDELLKQWIECTNYDGRYK